MFPQVEIRFEIVEIRMESKGDHKAPISKRKKKTHFRCFLFPRGELPLGPYEFPLVPGSGY